MRYDAIKPKYPEIDSILDGIAKRIHAGATPEMATAYAEDRIQAAAAPADQLGVRDKCKQWIGALCPGHSDKKHEGNDQYGQQTTLGGK